MSSAFKSAIPKHPKRRLAAILAADVVAYSRLMGADEEGTLESLKAHRRQLINPKITEHKGRIVKTTGDGILIEFSSVVDALRCGTEVQLGMIERNVAVPREKRIEFRVGINVGDIILDAGDIYGDGVNIAARLKSLAEPGTVYISGSREACSVEGMVTCTSDPTNSERSRTSRSESLSSTVLVSSSMNSGTPSVRLAQGRSEAV